MQTVVKSPDYQDTEPVSGAGSNRRNAVDGAEALLPGPAEDLACTYEIDGSIRSVNSAACEILGLPADVLCRMTIPQLLPPESAAGFDLHMQKMISQGFAVSVQKLIGRDGRRQFWECRSTPSPDGLVRGIARDVTEREEAVRRARRSEEHFRSIIENVSDIIAILEVDGRFRYGSPSVSRVLGYSREDLYDKPGISLIHPSDAARAATFMASQSADLNGINRIELRVRHQDSTWRSFEIVASNIVKNGQTSAVVVNARDITARKHLETQLLEANRLGGLGRLAATVAHEFNNVLMGMQPFSELLQRPGVSAEIVTKGGWHIANSIKRGKRIVLDILRFAQPQVPVTASIDLGAWWETFAPEAEAVLGNLITLTSSIPLRGLCVLTDRSQLSQIVANLVSNARDAMTGGGTLTLSATPLKPGTRFSFGAVMHPEKFVQISIRDTGHGMSPDVLTRIFEPLFTTRKSGGTGLGLAVAHQLMMQQGGSIFAESEPGEGTTFHLFLPLAEAPPVVAAATRPRQQQRTAARVLIIDDEEAIVEGIATLLEAEGMEVDTVAAGGEAESAIARFRPTVVVLDFGLPDMDGAEVYARIRELHPFLPVIFATGHGDRRVLLDRLNDPLARFLQKPFEITTLLATIAELQTKAAS